MDGVQLPQGYRHFEEEVYFLSFRLKDFYPKHLLEYVLMAKYRFYLNTLVKSTKCKLFRYLSAKVISCTGSLLGKLY